MQQRQCDTDVDIRPLQFDYAGCLDDRRANTDIIDGADEYVGRLH